MKTIEGVIIREIFKYGVLPMLYVLQILEENDDFEMCQTVLNVLNDHCEKYDIDIPRKYNEEAVVSIRITFMEKFNLTGDNAYANIDFCASEILYAIDNFQRKQNVDR